MPIADVSEHFRESTFSLFRDAVAKGGVVRGFAVVTGGRYSRKDIDTLTEQAKQLGAGGLVWVRLVDNAIQSSALKAAGEAALKAAFDAVGGKPAISPSTPQARQPMSRASSDTCGSSSARRKTCSSRRLRFLWVTGFPLFERDDEAGRWNSMHHPFTSPRPEDVAFLEADPARVRARAYDLALNGSESPAAASASIRPTFSAGVPAASASRMTMPRRDSFLPRGPGLRHAAHGGIAFGLDRIITSLCGARRFVTSLRFRRRRKRST